MKQIKEALEIIANQGINPSNTETIANALKMAQKEINNLREDFLEMSDTLLIKTKELEELKALNNTKAKKDPKKDPKPEKAIKK